MAAGNTLVNELIFALDHLCACGTYQACTIGWECSAVAYRMGSASGDSWLGCAASAAVRYHTCLDRYSASCNVMGFYDCDQQLRGSMTTCGEPPEDLSERLAACAGPTPIQP